MKDVRLQFCILLFSLQQKKQQLRKMTGFSSHCMYKLKNINQSVLLFVCRDLIKVLNIILLLGSTTVLTVEHSASNGKVVDSILREHCVDKSACQM